MFDPSSHIGRSALIRQLEVDVDRESIAAFEEAPRGHLGASITGKECKREVWYGWRWIKREALSGRKYRLFNRGHREEERFLDRLRGIGCVVYDLDPATGKQFRISGAKGHYGGSGDGLGYLPPQYGINDLIVYEFKTHNEKSFAKLAGKILKRWPEYIRKDGEGLKKSKPEHFAQMSQYGRCYGARYGLYCAVNKDTDELYFELVELDWALADNIFADAEMIVFSQTPPPKISESPAYFTCKFCPMVGVCHSNHAPDKNCRSCANAFPVDNAEWHCQVHNAIIPADVIPVGCDAWRSIV